MAAPFVSLPSVANANAGLAKLQRYIHLARGPVSPRSRVDSRCAHPVSTFRGAVGPLSDVGPTFPRILHADPAVDGGDDRGVPPA